MFVYLYKALQLLWRLNSCFTFRLVAQTLYPVIIISAVIGPKSVVWWRSKRAQSVRVFAAEGVVCCRCAAWQRWRAAAGPPPPPPSPAVSAGAVAVLALGLNAWRCAARTAVPGRRSVSPARRSRCSTTETPRRHWRRSRAGGSHSTDSCAVPPGVRCSATSCAESTRRRTSCSGSRVRNSSARPTPTRWRKKRASSTRTTSRYSLPRRCHWTHACVRSSTATWWSRRRTHLTTRSCRSTH